GWRYSLHQLAAGFVFHVIDQRNGRFALADAIQIGAEAVGKCCPASSPDATQRNPGALISPDSVSPHPDCRPL
ncbi:MAG: hypothetical protein OEW58_07805, partial [Gammaproteobacteria bacterium]|nr:hypothetical protein [Gammaproteobacteria bacterium]